MSFNQLEVIRSHKNKPTDMTNSDCILRTKFFYIIKIPVQNQTQNFVSFLIEDQNLFRWIFWLSNKPERLRSQKTNNKPTHRTVVTEQAVTITSTIK